MSWTDPRTWSVGEKVRAAWLNAQLRDNLNYLYGPPRLVLRRNSDLTLTPGAHVAIPWSEALTDIGGWFDIGSPTVAVCPESAFYGFNLGALFDIESSGDRQLRLLKNGQELRGDRRPATNHTEVAFTAYSNLAIGDEISFDVRSTADVDVDLVSRTPATGYPTRSPVLFIVRIAPPVAGMDPA